MNEKVVIPVDQIENIILLIRGQKVILSRDLAQLYGVTTGNLNKAVKRNIDRFPNDFMFQLTPEENKALRFHFGILEKGQHSKYRTVRFYGARGCNAFQCPEKQAGSAGEYRDYANICSIKANAIRTQRPRTEADCFRGKI